LDIGFGPQINDIVDDPLMPKDHQTVMFSATYPREIQDLARNYLRPDFLFLTVGKIGAATDLITQKFIYTQNYEKEQKVVEIIKQDSGKTLIFARTKKRVDELAYLLQGEGFPVSSIHGDHSQNQRNSAMRSFLHKESNVLVATDVAARGLDIRDVNTVINFDMPNEIDSYVHRIGRTGRAGKKGIAVSFLSDDDISLLRDLTEVIEGAKQQPPAWFQELQRKQREQKHHRQSSSGFRSAKRPFSGKFGSGSRW
jgi:ATP-dependent RNA helicase DDX3X